MSFDEISFILDILPENTKHITYKSQSIPIDYDLLKRNSNYFRNNNKRYENESNIPLLEEEGNLIEFPIFVIKTFIQCCQNQKIEINKSNIFYLNYLSKKYEVHNLEKATNGIISSNRGQLALESLFFILQIHKDNELSFFDTKEEELILSANFDHFMQDERIFQIPIPILYRIVKNYYSTISQTKGDNIINDNNDINKNDVFSDFLFKLLDKNREKASMFFEFFDISKNRIKDLVKLHDCYSDVFDPRFFNSSLFNTTVELIKELTKLKEEFSNELSEMKKFSDDQKNLLTNAKAEMEQKNQELSNEIKENIKFCIDSSKCSKMAINSDIVLPHDAYVCVEMSAAHYDTCYLTVNGVVVQQQGAEKNFRCRSAVSIMCKKGDHVKIYTNGGNSGFPFACYFGLK